jgi:outer membrane receptor for ferrienterochelin and colicin
VSFQYNDIKEDYFSVPPDDYDGPRLNPYKFMEKKESVPGVFSQYTYTDEKTSIVLGLRYDYNTLYKQSLFTPRLHVKRDIFEHGVIRGSIGRAYRSPIALAENLGLLASARELIIPKKLGLEDAWNYGINYYHIVHINDDQVITISFDAYRTHFNNQLIVDLDQPHQNPAPPSPYQQFAYFYMSSEKAYANSFQLETRTDVIADRWSLTLAGRYNESKQTTNGKLQDKIYVPRWKFLMVNNITTNMNKWMFDLTSQWNGKVRLPNTDGARPKYSEPYPMFFAQITRRFKNFDVYVGCENIFNTVQKDPIIDYQNPFSDTFDATVIYGSLMSRAFYVGLRWTL